MNTNNRLLLTIIITTVIAFFSGWPIFGIIFGDFYSSNMNPDAAFLMKTEPALWPLFFATLAWSALLTLVLHKTGNVTFKKGFLTSLWLSFFLMVMFDFNMFAFWDLYNMGFIFVDIIVGTIYWALIGGISGAMLAMRKKTVQVT